MTLEERRAKDRAYYAAHRERKQELKRRSYQRHKLEVLERQAKWYSEHKEVRQTYNRRYYELHKEEILEKAQAYYWNVKKPRMAREAVKAIEDQGPGA